MNDFQIIVQSNIAEADLSEIKQICVQLNVDFVPIYVIPFSAELPAIDRSKKTILYGSTTLCDLAFHDTELKKGVFFDPDTFSMERQLEAWGTHMLNSDSVVYTAAEILDDAPNASGHWSEDAEYFIRPDGDGKEFAGAVMPYSDVKAFLQRNMAYETSVQPGTKIVLSTPKQLSKEYRLWILDGSVVSASQYRTNFRLDKDEGCPDAVRQFAEDVCRIFTPVNFFVMDVATTPDGAMFIIECNCANAAGFYKGDKLKIFEAMVKAYPF